MGNGASSPKRADQSDAKNKTNNDTTAKKIDAAKQGKDTAAATASGDDADGSKSGLQRSETTQKIDDEDITGHMYVCVNTNGILYRNTAEVGDVNEELHKIKLNEVVQPKSKKGDWLCVTDDHWLPLVQFWGDGDRKELMARYNADQDEDDFAKQRQAKLDAEMAAMLGAESDPAATNGKTDKDSSSWNIPDDDDNDDGDDAISPISKATDQPAPVTSVTSDTTQVVSQSSVKKAPFAPSSSGKSRRSKRSKKDRRDRKKRRSKKQS